MENFPLLDQYLGKEINATGAESWSKNDYGRHNYIHRQNQLTDYSSGWGAPASATTGRPGSENVTQYFIIQRTGPLSWHELIFPGQYTPVRGALISRKEGREEGGRKEKRGEGREEGERKRKEPRERVRAQG